MKQQEIIDFYVENGCNFPLTQNETQLPAFRLQILLAKAGVLKIQDKINYGSKAQKLGGLAEYTKAVILQNRLRKKIDERVKSDVND